jgi:hypothetical protein
MESIHADPLLDFRKNHPHRFTLEEIEEASELMQGLCLAYGAVRDCREPDARRCRRSRCRRSGLL